MYMFNNLMFYQLIPGTIVYNYTTFSTVNLVKSTNGTRWVCDSAGINEAVFKFKATKTN